MLERRAGTRDERRGSEFGGAGLEAKTRPRPGLQEGVGAGAEAETRPALRAGG